MEYKIWEKLCLSPRKVVYKKPDLSVVNNDFCLFWSLKTAFYDGFFG